MTVLAPSRGSGRPSGSATPGIASPTPTAGADRGGSPAYLIYTSGSTGVPRASLTPVIQTGTKGERIGAGSTGRATPPARRDDLEVSAGFVHDQLTTGYPPG